MRDDVKYLLWQVAQSLFEDDKSLAESALKEAAVKAGVVLIDANWMDSLQDAVANCYGARLDSKDAIKAIAIALGFGIEESTPKGEQLPVTAEYSTVTI
jgi:hypothetical protein